MTEQNIQLTKRLQESIKRLERLKKVLTEVLNSGDAERQILLEMRINLLKPLKERHQYLKQKLNMSIRKTKDLDDLLHIKSTEANNSKKLSEEVINQKSTLQ